MAYCSVEVDCPATAEEGEVVLATLKVTNLDTYYNWIFKSEIWADTELIGSGDEVIPSGQSRTYYGYFVMPAHNVSILGWVNRVTSIEPWREVFCGADSAVISYIPTAPPPCSISISAPGSAEEGQTVQVTATITNNSPYAQLYKTEMYAGPDRIGIIEDTIPGYSSQDYGGSFTMPAGDITVLVWVEVSYLGAWQYSHSASSVVELYAAPPAKPEFRGFALSEYTK